ncbi:MAG: pantetheine-phosphate adenylyltransferase [Xylanivirga thermophila]|jgi:pantetheine-phosphate adenylyltransferase|uniref:pantetheine-phosphate adenylyltransferase n=1 Tax=Xylanivirga thermophila TaxID=2496273 RepID=UPI00101D73BC|nr:pantetheine-phosphate adenylyltransferase [Xylanivirga thermophila]
MITAIYPGSFDPVTNGHLDIIKRSAKTFDKVIVAIAQNPNKTPMFTIEERMDFLKRVINGLPNVEVDHFDGLLVDYVKEKDAHVIIKGLRAISDFEYEFQMALMNRKLDSDIETLFMMTSYKYSFLSSSMMKEVGKLGGCIAELVPDAILPDVLKRLKSV